MFHLYLFHYFIYQSIVLGVVKGDDLWGEGVGCFYVEGGEGQCKASTICIMCCRTFATLFIIKLIIRTSHIN